MYGGSVNGNNVDKLKNITGIDGFLVGGASQNPKKFIDMLKKEEIEEGRFSKQLIKQAGGIAFDKRYYMGNMSGAVKAIEKLKKGLSDDPKIGRAHV